LIVVTIYRKKWRKWYMAYSIDCPTCRSVISVDEHKVKAGRVVIDCPHCPFHDEVCLEGWEG